MNNPGIIEKEYPISLFNRIFFGLFAVFFAGSALLLFAYPPSRAPLLLWILEPIIICLFILMIRNTLKKVTITEHSIIYKGLFSTRQIPFDAIKGCRYNSRAIIIVPLGSGYTQIAFNYFEHKHAAELREWALNNFKNLDEEDLQRAKEQLLQDEKLGSTELQRKQALRKAKNTASTYNILSTITALVCNSFNDRFSSALLIIIPVVGIGLFYTSKGLIKFYSDSSSSIYARVYIGIILSSVFLFVHTAQYNIFFTPALAMLILIVMGIFILVIYTKGASAAADALKQQIWLILMVAFFYGCGCIRDINCRFDDSYAKLYGVKLVRSHVSNRSSGQVFYFELDTIATKKFTSSISVPYSTYTRYKSGDTVPVFVKEGCLHIPWFWVNEGLP